MPRRALVAGATGLVGGELVRQLAADRRWQVVHLVGRREMPAGTRPPDPDGKLREHVIDFGQPASLVGIPAVDDVFICLGTTRRDAGSQHAFRRVDFDHVVSLAHMARRHGAERIAVVSAIGADPRARSFYLRTKGETEEAICSLGFRSTTLLRPSILDGERSRRRPLEHAALVSLRLLGALVPVRWRPVAAGDVATAMREAVARGAPGVRIVESDHIPAPASTARPI
jgi:uncharacterized protein YbjT (DUF2867 family)